MGMKGIFPFWKKNTYVLARRFISLGFKAVITSIDTDVLAKHFVKRENDEQFLFDLPQKVDSCGENGEFHSLVYYSLVSTIRYLSQRARGFGGKNIFTILV